MYFIKIDDYNAAQNLYTICSRYRDYVNVTVSYGVQNVDGTNLIGIVSLMGNLLKIETTSTNHKMLKKFHEDVEKIGAFKSKPIV